MQPIVLLKVPEFLKLVENQPELPQFSWHKFRQVLVLNVQPKNVLSFWDVFNPWIITEESKGHLVIISVEWLL